MVMKSKFKKKKKKDTDRSWPSPRAPQWQDKKGLRDKMRQEQMWQDENRLDERDEKSNETNKRQDERQMRWWLVLMQLSYLNVATILS